MGSDAFLSRCRRRGRVADPLPLSTFFVEELHDATCLIAAGDSLSIAGKLWKAPLRSYQGCSEIRRMVGLNGTSWSGKSMSACFHCYSVSDQRNALHLMAQSRPGTWVHTSTHRTAVKSVPGLPARRGAPSPPASPADRRKAVH